MCQTFGYVDHNKLWKFLKEMRIPDHLTCLLRNLYAGQEATVRTIRLAQGYWAAPLADFVILTSFKFANEVKREKVFPEDLKLNNE